MAKQYNNNLDVVRGLSAIFVVFTHLVSYPFVFDKNFGVNYIIRYNIPGHIFFLVFFILSGYVIELNTSRLGDLTKIKEYLRKRTIRIVPIYFAAVIFAFLITWGNYGWYKIICNLLFLSVPAGNLLYEETPVWSLNYEVVYYLSYIAFSYFSINLSKTVKFTFVFIILYFLMFHNKKVPPMFISYLTGFLFWSTGALFAKIKDWKFWNISASRLMSIFILIFCMQNFNPYGPILKVLHVTIADYSGYWWYQQAVSYPDLFFYPLTIVLILALTHSWTKYNNYIVYGLFAACLFRLATIFKVYGFAYLIKEGYVPPIAFLFLSMAFWFLDFELVPKLKRFVKSFEHFGHISYAMYLIHFPLLFMFAWYQATSVFTFCVKLVIYLAAVYYSSYVLEMKFQPYIKRIFRRKAVPVAATPVEQPLPAGK